MKKILTIALIALAFSANAQQLEQTQKGKMLAGGGFSIDLNSSKQTTTPTGGSSTTVKGPSVFNLGFNPNIGYFLFNNFAAGLKFDAGISNSKKTESYIALDTKSYDKTTTDNSNHFLAGPFIRYYAKMQPQMAFFGELSYSIGNTKSSYKVSSNESGFVGTSTNTKVSGSSVGFGPGLSYFINKNIGIEALLTYNLLRNKFPYPGGTELDKYQTFKFNIGLQVYL